MTQFFNRIVSGFLKKPPPFCLSFVTHTVPSYPSTSDIAFSQLIHMISAYVNISLPANITANTEKYGSEKTPYMDTLHAVYRSWREYSL